MLHAGCEAHDAFAIIGDTYNHSLGEVKPQSDSSIHQISPFIYPLKFPQVCSAGSLVRWTLGRQEWLSNRGCLVSSNLTAVILPSEDISWFNFPHLKLFLYPPRPIHQMMLVGLPPMDLCLHGIFLIRPGCHSPGALPQDPGLPSFAETRTYL
jgi:hypothetical protein